MAISRNSGKTPDEMPPKDRSMWGLFTNALGKVVSPLIRTGGAVVVDAAGATLTTATPESITVGNVSTVVKAANADRKQLILVNDSIEAIYIALGADAALNKGIPLHFKGSGILIDASCLLAVNAICASGGKNLCVIEGV